MTTALNCRLAGTSFLQKTDHVTGPRGNGALPRRQKPTPVLPALLVFAALLLPPVARADSTMSSGGQVSVTEDTLTLPTYLVNPPSPLPRFYESGSSHQGVQRRVYPYPMNDNLTRAMEDRSYSIIYIENEYIKLGIMPGLGGRVFEAIDKTDGYNYFYRQHVIKPSLIGMLGYWISGGLAWGFPHHHGPNTVEPMDYLIEKHADGSVTVWLAYTELRHRMRILLGYTVFPGSSALEMTIRPSNPTPYINSFLFWANPSVHCDTNYEVIFPPSVRYVTQHHKREMNTWPIADRRYNNFDYAGVDISMWKNTGVPSSFFAWDPQDDFFGGYDFGKQAGTVWVGNHHVCVGMKYWADGNNPAGEMINEGLTDNDGRYTELMSGAYADNQPDYSWLQPYESKDVKMTWYPIRLMGGLKAANQHAALNLTAGGNGNISVRLNTTSLYKSAKVVLTSGGKSQFSETIDISPARPYAKEIDLVTPARTNLVRFALYDRAGEAILEYQPEVSGAAPPIPKPLESPPLDPKDIKTVEELYLTGLRINQFFNASFDPYPYYLEALRRDPGEYRVNTQMGVLCAKQKMWEQAERYLLTALDRITLRYTRPKDSDAFYYLGLVQRRLHKNKEAYDHFYDATWNAGWHTPGYQQLAEMDCERHDYATALDHINRALSTDVNNLRALNLKTVILRKLGRLEEAEALALNITRKDRLDHQSRNELYLIQQQMKQEGPASVTLADLEGIMRDRTQSSLELAAYYCNAGLYEEAAAVLERLERKGDQFPMLYYYSGYCWSKLGREEKARQYFAQARTRPYTYCFPFRDESVDVLEEATRFNPDDARAYYYLGNLYCELQPEKAVQLWEKSQSLDNGFYIVQRNLGWVAQQQGDIDKATNYYERAFINNREDPRLIFEYDTLCANAKVPPQQRYEHLFKDNRRVVEQRSETFIRELELLVFLRRYDEVIEIADRVKIVESEGSATLRDVYQNAHILRSLKEFNADKTEAALDDMKLALKYPVGRWGNERKAQINYLLGAYYEKLGDGAKAKDCYAKVVSEHSENTEYQYEKGLALMKLGQSVEAREQFSALVKVAESPLVPDYFRSFEAGATGPKQQAQNQYLIGLAYQGMNRQEAAKAQFRKALEINPAHVMAQSRLMDDWP
jgi:tetratricopeptide (TPR) repeat protein